MAVTASGLIVQSVLDLNSRTQDVIVQETAGIVSSQRPVSGATVTILAPDGQLFTADEVKDSTVVQTESYEPKVTTIYRISLDKYNAQLIPGGTYRLTVLADGMTVTGSTILPGGAPPQSQSASPPDTLHLAWRSVPYTTAYEISVSANGRYFLQKDTTAALTGDQLYRSDLAAPLSNAVTVAAVDANYYDFYRRSTDSFTGTGVINHLVGGTGVFGAVARVMTVTLK